jgi:RND superfamily putative drug exporter
MARWSATHPWRAILIWVVFVVICTVAGGAAGTRTATDLQQQDGQAGHAMRIAHKAGLSDPVVENVLITARSGSLDLSAARAVAGEVGQRMRGLGSVGATVTSRNGQALLVPVTMPGDPDTAGNRVSPLLRQTEAVQKANRGLRVEEAGPASINHGVSERVGSDLGRAEGISMPVTLVIMLVAFGALLAAGAPVLLAISAVMAAMGLASLASHVIPAVETINSVILLMGMAVGVDYSLFYLKREREERARGRSTPDAIEIAAATSGHSVVVSGGAVIVAMASLYLTGTVIFTSMATGAIVVVAVAVLGSLTVLPALLAKLGHRVDRPRVPFLWRLTQRSGPPRLWPALLRPAARAPGKVLAITVAALVALGLAALTLNVRWESTGDLPRSMPVMQSYDRMTEAFPAEYAAHKIVVRAGADRAGRVTAALHQVIDQTTGNPLFAGDQKPAITASSDGTVHVLSLVSPFDGNAPKARQALRLLRGDVLPATVGRQVPGAYYGVGGDTAGVADESARISGSLPLVVGFVLLLTFAMMAVAFRSVVVGLTTVAVNLLSALASFGALALIFQHSWAEGLLGFHSTGAVIGWIPLFLFVVLSGLSMDYHVFMVGRIREAAAEGMPTRQAVIQGITRSAGVVTSAAVVMVAVFAAFAALSFPDMKQMGVGLTIAVLLDALVVRAFLLPSLMIVLGRANWWPGRLPVPGGHPARTPMEPAPSARRP